MNAAPKGRTVEVTHEASGRVFVLSLKRRGDWRFPEDAIGMVDGHSKLSQRKGLGE
jgi:hypothetical protein